MSAAKSLKLMLLIIACVNIHTQASCQSYQQNSLIFFDGFIGYAVGNTGGFGMGLGINYQENRSIFTARALGTVKFGGHDPNSYRSAPIISVKNGMGELALLYGLRTIENGHAYSFSIGVSYNHYFDNTTDYKYFGIPVEANYKWFKRERERKRLFGLIPIGQPNGYGDSFGFKLFGNISRQSYAGIGLSVGLGYHKVYD